MDNNLVNMMLEKGIRFEAGYKEELNRIEEVYKIHMPEELKSFFMEVFPVSDGFYNWKDFNNDNVTKINMALNRPSVDLKECIEEVDWCESWGMEPEDHLSREKEILHKLEKAPMLIPLYNHRYIGSQYEYGNPIFSVWGSDIIYYGENLEMYLYMESGNKKIPEIDYRKIKRIEFWSDLAE